MTVIRDAMQGMLRNRLMTAIAVLSIAVALFIFGVIGTVTLVAHEDAATQIVLTELVGSLQASEEMNVYLADAITDADMLAIDETINMLPEVGETRIITREDARREFAEMFGIDLLTGLDENPLPRTIVLHMAEGRRTSGDLGTLAARIRTIEGVESVEYGTEWLSRLDIFLMVFVLVETVLIALVSVAAIFIISNTITLTVMARKDAIEIMQLVGATDGYIRRPFYLEGMVQGLLAGCLTFLAFWGLYAWLRHAIPQIDVYLYLSGMLRAWEVPIPAVIALIMPVGGVLGMLGSYVAVRRTF